ncbi:hypothetical protein ACH4T9_19410 [Micromonospora sp. NPDC020750]|uniref:hypothetical protein n=1 Tax=unclassified Micromonospora TaxID=2617518 RepID=UPI0037B215CA
MYDGDLAGTPAAEVHAAPSVPSLVVDQVAVRVQVWERTALSVETPHSHQRRASAR